MVWVFASLMIHGHREFNETETILHLSGWSFQCNWRSRDLQYMCMLARRENSNLPSEMNTPQRNSIFINSPWNHIQSFQLLICATSFYTFTLILLYWETSCHEHAADWSGESISKASCEFSANTFNAKFLDEFQESNKPNQTCNKRPKGFYKHGTIEFQLWASIWFSSSSFEYQVPG